MTKAKQPKADVTTEIKEEGSTHEVEPALIDRDSDISAKNDKEKSKSPKTKFKIIDY
jgi:hypothetical protein